MTLTNDLKRLVAVKCTLRVPGEPDQATTAWMPRDVALATGRKFAEAA